MRFTTITALAIAMFAGVGQAGAQQPTTGMVEFAAIHISNLDQAISFYTEVLGMKEVNRSPPRPIVNVLFNYSGKIEDPAVILVYDSMHKAPYTHGEALDRIGLLVPDVMGLVARCKASPGCVVVREPKSIPSDQNAMIGFIKDSDGFSYEVIQQAH